MVFGLFNKIILSCALMTAPILSPLDYTPSLRPRYSTFSDHRVYYRSSYVVNSDRSLAKYPTLSSYSELSVRIPGILDGFIPQGIDYLPETNWFLFSGYRTDGGTSSIIATDAYSGKIMKQVSLLTPSGKYYTGHAGGIAVSNSNIFVVSGSRIYSVPISDFLSQPDISEIQFKESFEHIGRASYCFYDNQTLWVGEYENSASGYDTPKDHMLENADGVSYAWLVGYELEDGYLIDERPDYILTTPSKIQGGSMLNGNIYLSQSYSRRSSGYLLKYDNVMERKPNYLLYYNEHYIPVWYLDSKSQVSSVAVPSMCESLCVRFDSLYLAFESASYVNRFQFLDFNTVLNPMDRVVKITGF